MYIKQDNFSFLIFILNDSVFLNQNKQKKPHCVSEFITCVEKIYLTAIQKQKECGSKYTTTYFIRSNKILSQGRLKLLK